MPREPLTRNLIPPPGFKVQKADPRLYHPNRQGAWKEGKWGGGGGSARKTMGRVSDDEQPANMVSGRPWSEVWVLEGSGLWKGSAKGHRHTLGNRETDFQPAVSFSEEL